MKRVHGTRSAIAFFTVVIGMLLALNWYLLQTPVDISPVEEANDRVSAPWSPNLKLSTPLDDKPAMQFQEVVNRPLFNPSRRQIKREVEAPDSVDARPSELQLVGVMKSSDAGARALIRFAGAQAGKWIAEGEQFNGWTLRNIGERSVMVEAGGRSHQLTLGAPRRPPDDWPALERGGGRR